MARRSKRNLGIIGLGIIGSRIADHLRRKGLPVFVWNRTPRPVPNFVGSPTELAELCDVIQIFVADDDAVLEMIQRMKATLNKQHVIIVNSTVSPDTVRAAAEIVERRGGRLVDAPFTGTREAAAKGELIYYLGGDPVVIQEIRPMVRPAR
jgi:3-hydroxyisobutyrate dehydrogenase-like beta-hydroxyacid dehydrogenase